MANHYTETSIPVHDVGSIDSQNVSYIPLNIPFVSMTKALALYTIFYEDNFLFYSLVSIF